MEHISINLDDASMYDELVHAGLPQVSDITVVTKDKGTAKGAPAVVIAFNVQLPDGSVRRAQATTTVRLLQSVAAATAARHGLLTA